MKNDPNRKRGSGLFERKHKSYIGTYVIYGLIDSSINNPTLEDIMYVGCTKQGLSHRRQTHLHHAKIGLNTKRNEWIRELLSNNKTIKMFIIEILDTKDDNEARKKETEYIKLYGKLNMKDSYKNEIREKINRDYLKEKVSSLFNNGKKIREISEETNIKKTKVHYWLKKMNLTKHDKIEEENKQIEKLLDEGYSKKEISKVLNISLEVIYRRFKKPKEEKNMILKIKIGRNIRQGIIREQNRWIIELLNKNYTLCEIAYHLSLSKNCIYSRIRKYGLNDIQETQEPLSIAS